MLTDTIIWVPTDFYFQRIINKKKFSNLHTTAQTLNYLLNVEGCAGEDSWDDPGRVNSEIVIF